jgi:hypothetical protein
VVPLRPLLLLLLILDLAESEVLLEALFAIVFVAESEVVWLLEEDVAFE